MELLLKFRKSYGYFEVISRFLNKQNPLMQTSAAVDCLELSAHADDEKPCTRSNSSFSTRDSIPVSVSIQYAEMTCSTVISVLRSRTNLK
jgi:hypothetical protein